MDRITKEQLEDLYINQGLSIRQCAEKLGWPTSGGMTWWLKKFGIKARPQLQTDKFHGGPRETHKKVVLCDSCGKVLLRFPSLIRNLNFCNFACKGEWQQQDLSGKRFGLLMVIEQYSRDKWNHIQWRCLCDCGLEKIARTGDLLNDLVKSCGCLLRRTGEDHPTWTGGKSVEVKCANPLCNNTKMIYPSYEKTYDYFLCNDKCRSKYRSQVIRGNNHPKWKPRIETSCAFCGKHLIITATRKRLYARSFCSVDCQGKWISENKNGENSPTWRGGLSFEPYPTTWTHKLRKMIRDRDGRVCQICGKEENGERLSVHHIDYDKKNMDPENLISLCHDCHVKTNFNRDQWINLFNFTKYFNQPLPLTGTYN